MSLIIKNMAAHIGDKCLVKDVSFTLKRGKVIGLVGPNGAGKTTLMRALLGLVEDQRGEIVHYGVDVSDLDAAARAKLMAYLPQGAPAHWPMSVQRVIELGRIPHLPIWGKLSDQDTEAVEAAIQQTGIRHLKDRRITTLSGGERAMVMLARALAVQAAFLIADEPTASLDPAHQLQVMEIVVGRARAGDGVLVSLHDLSLAHRFCDQLLMMKDGQIVAAGPPQEVLVEETLRSVFAISGKVDKTPFNRV